MTEAQKFYGASYAKGNGEVLEKAHRYLEMAIKADTETKREMAFKAALKAEAEAFG
jgi:hypothetical protein